MRLTENGLQLSASDIVNFAACKHATTLDARVALEGLTPPQDASSDLLRRKGLEHEVAILERYRSAGRNIADMSNVPWADRQSYTATAIRSGADVIYQGTLCTGNWLGIADFLEKVAVPSEIGPYSYEVADTKLARTVKPTHLLQLSLYNALLFDLQKVFPREAHVVLGDGRRESFRSLDSLYYTNQIKRRLESFVAALPATVPEPRAHCAVCRWAAECEAEWNRTQDLCLVANIRSTQMCALRAAGVSTITELANVGRSAKIPGMQPTIVERLCAQAELQTHKQTTGKNKYELLPVQAGKGFQRLPRVDEHDLYFDMEGDPLVPGGLEYLFGIFHGPSSSGTFVSFWGHDRAEEKLAFEKAIDFFVQHLAKFPNANIYHYAPYEVTAVRRLSTLHATREAEVDGLLRNEHFVDLYKVVRESILVSEPRYSIKNLEHFFAPKREQEVKTAAESIEVYEEWRITRQAELLENIERYNEQDCRSTKRLHEWLLLLRPDNTQWKENPNVQADDPEKANRQAEAERRMLDHGARLLASAAKGQEPFVELITQLLEFHRREAKPQYWAMFDRRDSTTEELVQDSECIGALTMDPASPPYQEKRSLVYTYRFPAQDFKFAAGDSCLRADTLNSAGTIVHLDEDAGVIRLKIGKTQPQLPSEMSIIPTGPIDAVVLREAIYRFADAVISGSARYKAVEAILKRERPRLRADRQASLLKQPGEVERETAIRVISDLDESAFIIQGPPGAGKTYVSSHSIVALIKKGKRVGISSNSHKAISNLLGEVVKVARAERVVISGLQKCSSEEQFYVAPEVTNTTKNPDSLAPYNIIAGTSWLFARPEYDQQIDFLFIDEAGQVSLANVVAIGTSTKNLVLVGDSMQLAQPTQGVHPGESGLSVLDFMMQGRSTVPEDMGLFLATSRRMHSSVCRFISDSFYESRLQSDSVNDRQRLILSAATNRPLKNTGISFISLEHEGCAQRSVAEAEEVSQLFTFLTSQTWVNREGIEAPVTNQDILVVSPYNMQVNLLREILPRGARVGTVDKFQGQQAPVVIVSFATSTYEDSPRGLDFLFSRNRLNVAISRAQCLAILVASARLLDASCHTVEQIRMVNALCWAKFYADTNACDQLL